MVFAPQASAAGRTRHPAPPRFAPPSPREPRCPARHGVVSRIARLVARGRATRNKLLSRIAIGRTAERLALGHKLQYSVTTVSRNPRPRTVRENQQYWRGRGLRAGEASPVSSIRIRLLCATCLRGTVRRRRKPIQEFPLQILCCIQHAGADDVAKRPVVRAIDGE